ncbi:MAG: twin-arginine translocation signal domain-containing protein [Gammaproteobacteria bacterium]|nr:twin-arginine translocation signal domain-containing protein [Gammaproteobacteria bacterium]
MADQSNKGSGVTRRRFIKTVGAAGLAASVGPFIIARPARAAKTLRILQWNHFVPAFDTWFNNTYIKEWGKKHDTEVIVDNVGIAALNSRAAAEVSAQKGHDLFMFLWPPPVYENQVIDHREIYQECQRRYGKPVDLAVKSTYNPKTKKYFGFSDSYVPDPVNYRKDLWDDVGVYPNTWEDIRVGGRKIKQKHGIPVGIGLSAELDTGMAMRELMYSFGASVQDAHGNLVLNSKHTLEAVKFVKALYQECMTPEVLAWDPSSNNRAMLAGRLSLVLNAISVTREGEDKKLPVTDNIWLAKAAAGPVRRMGVEHVMDVYVIWKFAQNIDGAKQFLVDYIGNFHQAFVASKFYNFPSFPSTVPDLQKLIAHDPRANPPDKYKVLGDVLTWATNVGYPGYANAAIDEVFNTWVLNTMFAKAATGTATPQQAIKEADARCRQIWAKWKAKGLI